MPTKNKPLFPPQRYFLLILIFLLTACGTVPAEKVTTPTSTSAATFTPTNTPTISPTETPSLTATPTSLPIFPLDGLRMAYIIEGNLYIQDSGKEPIQLTDSGKDHTPIFSDDGQKIVFSRSVSPNTPPHDRYSINADGSQEQMLITSSSLTALNLGYSEDTESQFLAFVPNTHQLLFQTYEYPSQTPLGFITHSSRNQDLLLVDVDTTVVKRLKVSGQVSFYKISPGGQLIWILADDHIDILGLDRKNTYSNLTIYPPASPYIAMPDIYWTQDLSKLSLVMPPSKTALGSSGREVRTIWQYPLDGSSTINFHLTPPPIANFYSISPDGNWIVYTFSYYDGMPEQTETSGIYIGNLRDGSSKLIESEEIAWLPNSFAWNPDSEHFIFWNEQNHLFLGDTNGRITPLATGLFLGWIDNSRYLYSFYDGIAMGEIGKEENVKVVDLPAGIKYINSSYFTFIFVASQTDE